MRDPTEPPELPWKAVPVKGYAQIINAAGVAIANVGLLEYAAVIVHHVNAFDKMREALKKADTLADEALGLVGSKVGTGVNTDRNTEDVRKAVLAFHRAVAACAAEEKPPAV